MLKITSLQNEMVKNLRKLKMEKTYSTLFVSSLLVIH